MNTNSKHLYALLVLLLPLLLGAILRFAYFPRTSLEVDEVTNFDVAEHILQDGFPAIKPEFGGNTQLYLFHPEIGYRLTAFWFSFTGNDSIIMARLLSILASLLVLLLVFAFAQPIGIGTALLAVFFIAADGWAVTINRMNYLENTQLVFILTGMILYRLAMKSRMNILTWMLSGAVLGAAIIYKHIGIFLLLVIIINWLLTKESHIGHCLLLISMIAVIVVYLNFMNAMYGQIYFDQQFVQLQRVFGFIPSRGMNFNVLDVLNVIIETYWIYITTVIVLVLGWPFAFVRFIQAMLKKREVNDAIALSWTIGGMIVAILSGVKSPHYLILWLIPLYIYIAGEINQWAKGRKVILIPVIVVLFTLANFYTWDLRFLRPYGDALANSAWFINSEVPQNSVVVTEPYIGELITQPYLRIDRVNLATINQADYMAIYSSTTARVTDLPELVQLYEEYCVTQAVFEGFKDKVRVCQIDHTAIRKISSKQ